MVSTPDKPIYRYVVRHGTCGRVARFGSIEPIDCQRGDLVVVHTDRGIERGEVLVGYDQIAADDSQPPTGELVRRMTLEDEKFLAALRGRTALLLDRCMSLLAEQKAGVTVVEGETLLDGRTTVLYFLGEADATLGPLSVELADDPRWRIRFEPLVLPGAAAGDESSLDDTAEGATEMKGPFERLKYDFRRVWECPACKRRERTEGSVTFRMCNCRERDGGSPTNMRMIEDGPRRTFPTRPRFPPLPEDLGGRPRTESSTSHPEKAPTSTKPSALPLSQQAVELDAPAATPPSDPLP